MIRFAENLIPFLRRATINAKEECLLLTIHGGRTRRLWPELLGAVAAARQENIRCLLLVPEQYTLQAERDLISGLRLPGFFDIGVLSLSRFVQRQFQQYSGGRARIDANGKPFWTMTGRFVCNNPDRDTDEYCLSNGYVSVVPVSPDFTCYQHIPNIKNLEL